jgi:hypothetical protein
MEYQQALKSNVYISMAQTAYEEAGMWAVKAITEGI